MFLMVGRTFMLKPLLISAVVLFSNAAYATPTMKNLFDAITATGTEIVVDHPVICKDKRNYGMYQYQHKVVDRLIICVENHNGDSAELYDTIIHESVHVAQFCRGSHIFTKESILNKADPRLVMFVSQSYPRHQVAEELEARVIAANEDEVFVTNLIKANCK